jgi:hypothetical protein
MKTFNKTALLILLGLLIHSCDKETPRIEQLLPDLENVSSELENDPTSILNFYDITSNHYNKEKALIPIIKIRLWRRSCPIGYCLCGLGVCEVWFLGHQIYKSSLILKDFKEDSKPSREVIVPLDTYESGVGYLRLFLADDVSEFDEEDLMLYVDEDIYDSFEGDTIILLEGEYPFDPELGEFGGYKIKYELIIN